MDYFQAILLGIIQGLTEFLPVSSSGHLILAPHLLGFEDQGLAMDAILHLATLLAMLIFFRKDLWNLLRALLIPKSDPVNNRLAWGIVAATVPAGVAGLAFGDWIESQLRSSVFVACNLIVWSMVFWVADRNAPREEQNSNEMAGLTFRQILFIGFAQAIALLPGTSRSGITIAAGLFMKLSQPTAARFSFLLGTPAILAAGLLKSLEVANTPAEALTFSYGHLIAGFVAAFFVGYASIYLLLKIVSKVGLQPFIIYRLILAVTLLAFYR